jgi:multiple sugar transport system permease protein
VQNAPRLLKKLLLYLLLIGVAAVFLAPLLWELSSSLKPEYQIIEVPARWIPHTFTLEHYRAVLDKYPFGRWMWNSVWVASVATVLVILVDSLAGYALARFEFRGRNALFALIISMLLVPIQVTVIPLFLIFAEVKMLDTYTALILPTVGNVTGVFLLRQFFVSIPVELEEAARIDGCSDLRIWWSIIMPLARPAIAAVATVTFVSSWNNFLWPLIATNKDATKTLPVGIAHFMSATSGTSGGAPAYGPPLAGAIMAIAPALLAFLLLQRYFVQGISRTGVKG